MPEPTYISIAAFVIAFAFLARAFVVWLLPVDWWPTGSPPEEEAPDADLHE